MHGQSFLQTVCAVRRNELYVITHDEGLEPLRRRFERMQQSILQRRKG